MPPLVVAFRPSARRGTTHYRQRLRMALLLRLEVGGKLGVAPVNRESSTVIALLQAQRQFFGVVGSLTLRERGGGEVGGRVVVRAEHTGFLVEDQRPLVAGLFPRPDAVLALGDRDVAESKIGVGRERGRVVRPQAPEAADLQAAQQLLHRATLERRATVLHGNRLAAQVQLGSPPRSPLRQTGGSSQSRNHYHAPRSAP